MELDDFLETANPHGWLLVADNLHTQAQKLFADRSELIVRHDPRTGERSAWSGTNRATFLLGGFALENMLKAFLTYENPSWVSNGRLAKPLRTHELSALYKKIRTAPYRGRHTRLMRRFEDGLESWARYPCSLSMDTTEDEQVLEDELWNKYMFFMGAAFRRMKENLSAGWDGPHGFDIALGNSSFFKY